MCIDEKAWINVVRKQKHKLQFDLSITFVYLLFDLFTYSYIFNIKPNLCD